MYYFIIFLMIQLSLFASELTVKENTLTVKGKEVKVLSITQPNGEYGITLNENDRFDVVVKDQLDVPTSIHWHGLVLPNNQDGVAFITQFPIYPNESYPYNFPLVQSGTYWMHSHYGLQEQLQLIAPLIIHAPDDNQIANKEVVMLLSDFSFKSPMEIFHQLKTQNLNMKMADLKHEVDIIDVKYDAFLTNFKSLLEPEIIAVSPGQKVRLRIIDGASASNFFLDIGELEGELIAVDGHKVQPIKGKKFEIAVAQRLDIVVTIPKEGVFPILAQGEGTNLQTGLILVTSKTQDVLKIDVVKSTKAGALTNTLEKELRAVSPLPKKPIDKSIVVELGGNMIDYVWTMNGQVWPESTPLVVEKGQRVEIVFKNTTSMSHPMHLHGHVFQVTEIDGQKFDGAMRDTVLVMPNSTLSIQFDADNPGVWPLHCHILYHMEAGMFTVLKYKNFNQI